MDSVAFGKIKQEINDHEFDYAAKEQNVLQDLFKEYSTFPFFIIFTISMPVNVRKADSKLLNKSMFWVHHLIKW
jgi:hypothetical protein